MNIVPRPNLSNFCPQPKTKGLPIIINSLQFITQFGRQYFIDIYIYVFSLTETFKVTLSLCHAGKLAEFLSF